RHSDDGADDGGIVRVRADTVDERLIDLERIDWKALQIGKAGIPDPEVVHRQAHTHTGDLLENLDIFLTLHHEDALGELELERRGWQSGFRQDLLDERDKTRAAKLIRREIHRHPQLRVSRLAPTAQLAAGLTQHPLAYRHDHAGLFGHMN